MKYNKLALALLACSILIHEAPVKAEPVGPINEILCNGFANFTGTGAAATVIAGVQGKTANTSPSEFQFGIRSDQALVLHGTSEGACINVGAAGSGASWAAYMKWTEQ